MFFYQSPFGGRVFFDDLGPPWPKHPCTDHASASGLGRSEPRFSTSSFGSTTVHATETKNGQSGDGFVHRLPHAWRPLVAEQGKTLEKLGEHARYWVDRRERIPGSRMYLPIKWFMAGPIYWRWHPEYPGWIQLSSIEFSGKSLVPREIITSIPGWLRNDDEYRAWIADPEAGPTAEQMNAIGWALSFAWRPSPESTEWTSLPGVDLKRARECFEIAATTGCWQALNNLGAIYRDGLGVEVDLERAFHFFR